MTDTPTPPDGWYPDPAGSGGTRRWDGTAWTDEVRPAAGARESASDAAVASASSGPDETPSNERATRADEPAAPAPVEPSPSAPGAVPAAASDVAAPAAASDVPAPAASAPDSPAPAAAAAAPSAAPAPVAPVAPVAPAAVPAGSPAYSSSASSAPASSFAPGYPAGAGAPVPMATKRDIPTNTVWVWLIVALPLVSVLMLFLFDWKSQLEQFLYAAVLAEQGGYSSSSTMMNFSLNSTLFSIGMSVLGLVLGGLSVLFAFLDWRQLRARGIVQPFHWAWAFFVFIVTAGVYVVGRGIVLRRQTGKGLGPVWGFIAVTVVSIVTASLWVIFLLRDFFAVMEQLMYTYSY